jgi:thymidylate synthase ThyX
MTVLRNIAYWGKYEKSSKKKFEKKFKIKFEKKVQKKFEKKFEKKFAKKVRKYYKLSEGGEGGAINFVDGRRQ